MHNSVDLRSVSWENTKIHLAWRRMKGDVGFIGRSLCGIRVPEYGIHSGNWERVDCKKCAMIASRWTTSEWIREQAYRNAPLYPNHGFTREEFNLVYDDAWDLALRLGFRRYNPREGYREARALSLIVPDLIYQRREGRNE